MLWCLSLHYHVNVHVTNVDFTSNGRQQHCNYRPEIKESIDRKILGPGSLDPELQLSFSRRFPAVFGTNREEKKYRSVPVKV